MPKFGQAWVGPVLLSALLGVSTVYKTQAGKHPGPRVLRPEGLRPCGKLEDCPRAANTRPHVGEDWGSHLLLTCFYTLSPVSVLRMAHGLSFSGILSSLLVATLRIALAY